MSSLERVKGGIVEVWLLFLEDAPDKDAIRRSGLDIMPHLAVIQ
jgi:hypothetical protein